MKHATRNPSASRRARAGFTVVELLLTVFVIGTAFVAGTWSMNATALTKNAYEREIGPASFLAREILTLADGLSRTPAGVTAATTGSAVMALDALIGASFSPPILADRSVAPGYEGWRQDVQLSVYALDNLAVPTADDPAAGLAPESASIYRLDVDISHGDEHVASHSWWIHP